MTSPGLVRELTLVNPHGLHLRPASKFVAIANRYQAEVWVAVNDGEEGNGKSILDLSARAAEKGARLRIRAVGEDALAAIDALSALVASGFDEMGSGG